MTKTNNTTGYQRKVGFFGSVKQLGVTTVAGANDVVTGGVAMAVNTTNVGVTITAIVSEATTLWGNDLLMDLQADAKVNAIHREIDSVQQQHELDALKEQLELAKAKRTRGPAKKK